MNNKCRHFLMVYFCTLAASVVLITAIVGCGNKVIYVEQPITTKCIREKHFASNGQQDLVIASDGSYVWVDFKKWVRLKVGQEYEADWQQ